MRADDNYVEAKIALIDSLWENDNYPKAINAIHSTMPYVIKEYGKDSDEYFTFLSMASQIYSDNDNNKQAIVLIDEVIKGLNKKSDRNDVLYAKALSNKALFHMNLGEAAKAIPIFGDAIQIYKQADPSLDYATCLKDLAIAYYDTGQYEKSISSVTDARICFP